jgi:hypothetical protein
LYFVVQSARLLATTVLTAIAALAALQEKPDWLDEQRD